jgi:hypothetical protein
MSKSLVGGTFAVGLNTLCSLGGFTRASLPFLESTPPLAELDELLRGSTEPPKSKKLHQVYSAGSPGVRDPATATGGALERKIQPQRQNCLFGSLYIAARQNTPLTLSVAKIPHNTCVSR